MTSPDRPDSNIQPRFALVMAVATFTTAALSLMYPMLSGQFLAGSDQVLSGYAFRQFAADMMQHTGHLPQWNPYIFGGMPLWAVPGHFDVFYPTALLRWFLNADTVLNLSFFIHLIVAGLAMYALLRTLRASWAAALVGGLAYELTGMLASQLAPGHDGKLYAAALAPLAFAALVRAIRHGRTGAFGWFALVIGLVLLTPHYLAAYYLLVASGLLTLWLVFLDPERNVRRSPLVPLVLAAIATLVGLGIGMVDLLPSLHMVPYTPRAVGGDSGGWAYATSYALPIEELMSVILPQFNGMHPEHYWGQNGIKDHTEYIGAVVAMLAAFGIPGVKRRKLLLPVGGLALLFLLVALGGHTPFYRLWYLLPRMSQFRAPGFAFFIVALMTCVIAGFGVDELLARRVSTRVLYGTVGVLGMIALVGIAGVLQSVAEAVAQPGNAAVMANAPFLEAGSVRLLLVVLTGGVVAVLAQRALVRGMAVAALLAVAVVGDNWSILRTFPEWLPPGKVTFADDTITSAVKKTPMPFRVYDPSVPEPRDQQGAQLGALQVYRGSALMARGVPTVFGYHGMESRYFDALFGGKNVWPSQTSPTLWDLYGVRYVVLRIEPQTLAGFHKVLGPVPLDDIVDMTSPTPQAVLFERDTAIQWVRVVPVAVKVNEEQIAPTVSDARFNPAQYVLLPDTSTVHAGALGDSAPAPTPVRATLASWSPGHMTVALDGQDSRVTFLVVSENWYPDWHVTVDGTASVPRRGNGALLAIELPPGARNVRLDFDVASYHTGKLVSLTALVIALLMLLAPRFLPVARGRAGSPSIRAHR